MNNNLQKTQNPPLSSKKKIFFVLTTITLMIVFLFFSAEIIVRIIKPHANLMVMTGRKRGRPPMADWAVPDAFCAYRGIPGKYPRQSGFQTINKNGFISTPEISYEKPKNTVRIAVLGGSSTAGSGGEMGDYETWPWQLKEILQKRIKNKNIEVINGALGGYSTFESLGRLWNRIRFYNPDIVIIYHGWNDMYYFRDPTYVRSWRTLPDGSWNLDTSPGKTMILKPTKLDFLLQYSQFLIRVRMQFAKMTDQEAGSLHWSNDISSTYSPLGPKIFRENLSLIRDAVKVMGADLYVIKQATLIIPNLSEKQRKRCGYKLHGFDHNAHIRAFNEIYQIIDEEIPNSSIIDARSLSGNPEYFQDHIHPTILGCSELAKIVADAIDPNIK